MAPKENVECLVRPYEPGDLNFILKCWLKSYRENLSRCPDYIYYPFMQKLILRLIQAPDTRVAICCDADMPEFIMGFCVAEPLRTADPREPLNVHFAFTKLTYRRNGILRYLLREYGWQRGRTIYTSHWTRSVWPIAIAYRIKHNPFLLMQLGVLDEGAYAGYSPGSVSDIKDVPVGEITRVPLGLSLASENL